MSTEDISHLGATSNILLEERKLRSQKPEVHYKLLYEGKSPVRRDSRPDLEDYTGIEYSVHITHELAFSLVLFTFLVHFFQI